jgi:hypothetical protein
MIEPTNPHRRVFLKLLVLSGAAVGAVGLPGEAHARKQHKKHYPGKVVFRLRTRKHHSCGACRKHHRFMIFRTEALAGATRAHPGCNCPVVTQKLPIREFKHLFGAKGVARSSGVADLRHVRLHHGHLKKTG